MYSLKITTALLSGAFTIALYPIALIAQEEQSQQQTQQAQEAQPAQPSEAQAQQPTQAQPSQPEAVAQPLPQKRNLWIAKFSTDTKAAAAVGAIQASDASALNYSNLFDSVKTFETAATQPEGTWLLTGKELDFSGGSTAKRALIGFGSGRAHITMEYTLYDPAQKVAWTQKITTKPSFWGSAGAMGAVQNQGKAMDEQGQKLINALSKFFAPAAAKAKK